MDKLKLEPTAALVMAWALPLYESGPVGEFVRQLDLSSGADLFCRCQATCDWYGEVILNRKHFIRHQIAEHLRALDWSQVVLLAAGKSPLGLELLLQRSSQISRVFEVDLAGMAEKEALYKRTAPEVADRLRCITADIASESLQEELCRAGFRRDIATIVVLEGISYYISEEALKRIIFSFRSSGKSIFILEYLLPCDFVEPSRRMIPKTIFSLIKESTGQKEIRCYSDEDLRQIFSEAGGRVAAYHSMQKMERQRTGRNEYFDKPGLGWIKCLEAEFRSE
ncbi:MAG: class I SAM-dependent methyltransferase [Methanothrix sp.]|nr:class I SAM-dependent methyltransferase [Methanothrix sp.]